MSKKYNKLHPLPLVLHPQEVLEILVMHLQEVVESGLPFKRMWNLVYPIKRE
jgi:hypothetical protein